MAKKPLDIKFKRPLYKDSYYELEFNEEVRILLEGGAVSPLERYHSADINAASLLAVTKVVCEKMATVCSASPGQYHALLRV